MRSRFSADLPLARYSVWCLLLLLPGHVFLSHLDRAVYDLIQGAEPHIFLFFGALTEIGDSKWTLVPTGILALLLVLAGRYGFSGRRPAAMSNWLASASFFVFCSVALSGIVVNVIKVLVGVTMTKKRLRGPMPDGAAELLYMEEPHHRCDTLVIGCFG
jgi:undecaprenyl-diphosphatase